MPLPPRSENPGASALGALECVALSITCGLNKKIRKRKLASEDECANQAHTMEMSADLLPLQQDVLFQQMAVFSAQLEIIVKGQRWYYKLKRMIEKE